MAIEEQQTVVVASVEVDDDYRVVLSQVRKATDYSPAQARQLARELGLAALEAESMLDERLEQVGRYEGPVTANGEVVL